MTDTLPDPFDVFALFERDFPLLAGEDNAGRLRRLRAFFGAGHPVERMALEVRKREVLAEEAADPRPGLWWLSFCDPSIPEADPPVPGGPSFLGVVVVEAAGYVAAIERARELGCNPGGEVSGYGPLELSAIAPEWRDRLLSIDDVAALPNPQTGDVVDGGAVGE